MIARLLCHLGAHKWRMRQWLVSDLAGGGKVSRGVRVCRRAGCRATKDWERTWRPIA